MHLALINDKRTSAEPNLKGLCPGCLQPVTAKCGTKRIWHWSHVAKVMCDKWWETETNWHRNWKNKFPIDQQEIIKYDPQSGEKHIADVYTRHGQVIEFQHSALSPSERTARECFYKNMIWVVDCTRLKRDVPRFFQGIGNLRPTPQKGYFLIHFPEECFPAAWLDSTVPVIFDFLGIAAVGQSEIENTLWCILPGRAERCAVVIAISRDQFVSAVLNRSELFSASEIVAIVADYLKQIKRREQQNSQINNLQRNIRHSQRKRTRRF